MGAKRFQPHEIQPPLGDQPAHDREFRHEAADAIDEFPDPALDLRFGITREMDAQIAPRALKDFGVDYG